MNLSLEIEQNRNQKARLCGVLDALTFGLLICDENLALDWANAEGRHLVNGSAHFVSRDQHVTLSDQVAHNKLKALCQPAMVEDAASTSQTIVLDRGGAEELQIRILPLPNHEEEWARRFLLILAQPDMPKSADPLHLAELFALTQAEGRVAAALLAGSTIKDYADERGIAEGSARNQLKQVLSKTGSRRQTDLIRKMFHSVLTPSLHYPKASRLHDLL
ncbi:hypothetical protein GRI39_11690 [Altererythrobacter indicus]|uniref:HTH luxR-type domain-containing protein n=1 Tax=Altericroceibacterium indicum TaxID=374177 RepID=A0A845AB13_9SPHN|nr:hypothetical protein [Altericroceibacterium indicum]MXP26697.1 hypothetical protein [Altericroceibacterium indicum]